jgi:hypothetical protein
VAVNTAYESSTEVSSHGDIPTITADASNIVTDVSSDPADDPNIVTDIPSLTDVVSDAVVDVSSTAIDVLNNTDHVSTIEETLMPLEPKKKM